MAKENCDLTLRITEISIYTCVCVRVCVCVCVCDWHTLKIKLPNSTNEIHKPPNILFAWALWMSKTPTETMCVCSVVRGTQRYYFRQNLSSREKKRT
jgi:alanine-alpha-ketoisovalerate/valine-pyruvate aminotransferase